MYDLYPFHKQGNHEQYTRYQYDKLLIIESKLNLHGSCHYKAIMSREIVRFDWTIKNILRDKANYVVLEGFLLALLGEEITIVNILESEGNQEVRDVTISSIESTNENSMMSTVFFHLWKIK